jgi:peptidoglycan/LPS O-acetylase OafA/YrhL
VKRKVAVYTILFALGIAGMLIYRYFTKGETVEVWEIVLVVPMLPLAGLVIWLRSDWAPAKVRDVVEKAERDWNKP